MRPPGFPPLLLLLLSLALCGCVERKLSVRSDPSAAEVTLDGEPIGKTPVSIRFQDYGGREVIVAKRGYGRLRKIIDVSPPYYQWFGLDIFFELIWPFRMVDDQVFTFTLTPLDQLKGENALDMPAIEKRAAEMAAEAEAFKAKHP